jgi:hypothetical protein
MLCFCVFVVAARSQTVTIWAPKMFSCKFKFCFGTTWIQRVFNVKCYMYRSQIYQSFQHQGKVCMWILCVDTHVDSWCKLQQVPHVDFSTLIPREYFWKTSTWISSKDNHVDPTWPFPQVINVYVQCILSTWLLRGFHV